MSYHYERRISEQNITRHLPFPAVVHAQGFASWLFRAANNKQIDLCEATGGNLVSGPTQDANRRPSVPADCVRAHHGSCAPVSYVQKSTCELSVASLSGHGHIGALISSRQATNSVPWRISNEAFLLYRHLKRTRTTNHTGEIC